MGGSGRGEGSADIIFVSFIIYDKSILSDTKDDKRGGGGTIGGSIAFADKFCVLEGLVTIFSTDEHTF